MSSCSSVIAGYTTDDIFYLEVCLYNQICANGAELFDLERGQEFRCKFSRARYRELQTMLLGEYWEPAEAYQCDHSMAG